MYEAGTTLRIDLGAFYHYGIADGDGGVIHNSKKRGRVMHESLAEFSEGHEVTVSSEIRGDHLRSALDKAMTYINVPYNLLSANCEHFVRLAHGLEVESVQLQRYLIYALGIGTVLKSKNETMQAVGAGSIIGALLTNPEESPLKNAAIGAVIALGLAALVS